MMIYDYINSKMLTCMALHAYSVYMVQDLQNLSAEAQLNQYENSDETTLRPSLLELSECQVHCAVLSFLSALSLVLFSDLHFAKRSWSLQGPFRQVVL